MKCIAGMLGIAGLAACDTGSLSEGGMALCKDDFDLAGTFTVETPQPAEISGCWPIGLWSFAATRREGTCTSSPAPLPNYQLRYTTVGGDIYEWTGSYVTDPADVDAEVSVSSGGGGLCEGSLTLYGAGGTDRWILRPALQAGGVLNGFAEFERFSDDVRPGPAED